MRPFLSIYIAAKLQHASSPRPHLCQEGAFWRIKNADGTIDVALKQRDAYPTTYCRRIAGAYIFGYGEHSRKLGDEYLHVILRDTGQLEVIRDTFATLPIYYAAEDSGCTLSNEYSHVVGAVQRPALNTDGIIEHIAMFSRIAPPIVQGIEMLEERETLSYTPSILPKKQRAANRPWTFSVDAPQVDPKDFMPYLTSHFDDFIASRLQGQTFAFQVSGGLDSATLPQYFAQQYKQRAPMASMLFTDHYATAQRTKLRHLYADRVSTTITSFLDPLTQFPLSHMVRSGNYAPSYSEHMYSECMIPVADRLQEQGITVLCTGEGADELFLNVTPTLPGFMPTEQERIFRSTRVLAPFVTQKFRDEYVENASKAAMTLPYRHHNMMFAQRCNNLYIRRDIWPVSPFFDADLYRFCQGMPAAFRANKNILRAFHQASGFEKAIYDTTENEYFDSFLDQSFRSGVYDQVMRLLVSRSVTVSKGYVDVEKLWRTYKELPSKNAAFEIYLFLTLEINLQFTPGLRL